MPINKIDYSKTQIIMIVCKEPDLEKRYFLEISTGLKNKIINMKKASKSESNRNYNLPMYKYIRENGGWKNFNIVILEDYNCESKNEALLRLNYWKNKINGEKGIV